VDESAEEFLLQASHHVRVRQLLRVHVREAVPSIEKAGGPVSAIPAPTPHAESSPGRDLSGRDVYFQTIAIGPGRLEMT